MNIYQLTNKFINEGVPIIVVSVVEKKGDGPVEIGKKLLVTKHEQAFGTVGGGALEYDAREYCKELFKTRKRRF
jgi:xanthine dehydrogenase accessory factor